MTVGEVDRLEELVGRARVLAAPGTRRVLGITGPPGSGKSTVAAAVLAALGSSAVVVPMDGFHLAGAELGRLGRADRKGAPDTFDAAGYVALLRRLRNWAASAGPIARAHRTPSTPPDTWRCCADCGNAGARRCTPPNFTARSRNPMPGRSRSRRTFRL
ncbi:hypothetical protein ROP_37530 [Rhodococcus opacus B4]|uniref:Phosphoribulokinase/uridine kinase domain-containing protein n=1 Tax=Rhodococcus opacus (strain B4) TaxID=632772 RepID=C1B8J7_RHOOB|nr:hypothetical protein ROP_37530 [Rhodococcus opacus B4]